jgi:hypothetical protein
MVSGNFILVQIYNIVNTFGNLGAYFFKTFELGWPEMRKWKPMVFFFILSNFKQKVLSLSLIPKVLVQLGFAPHFLVIRN